MKKLFYFLLIMIFTTVAKSQLLVENFDYVAGTNLTANGWTAHSGSGTNPIKVSSGGLSYTGYASSGIGNAALVNNTGEDVNRTFTTQSTGTMYYSFLAKVDGIAAGYFIHLGISTTTFASRVFIQSASGGFNVGLSNTSTGSFGTTVYTTGTTYLFIVKYDVSSTGTGSLWVFSSDVPATEGDAGSPEITTSGTGQTGIIFIALRQYSGSQNITVDGIRVGTSWNDAPLPVSLTSFTALTMKNFVELKWTTATEIQNYGWEIERSNTPHNPPLVRGEIGGWVKIGFVKGAGNSNSPKEYSFIDKTALYGQYSYRLKQIDLDGNFEYSDAVTVTVSSKPQVYDVKNFPNPFNPTTNIRFELPQASRVNLSVYNILGEKVVTLVDEFMEEGIYQETFGGSNLPSGVYFSVLQTDGVRVLKKTLLMK